MRGACSNTVILSEKYIVPTKVSAGGEQGDRNWEINNSTEPVGNNIVQLQNFANEWVWIWTFGHFERKAADYL